VRDPRQQLVHPGDHARPQPLALRGFGDQGDLRARLDLGDRSGGAARGAAAHVVDEAAVEECLLGHGTAIQRERTPGSSPTAA
jgi:hypothetical protein